MGGWLWITDSINEQNITAHTSVNTSVDDIQGG